jgi:hypothetical protein
MGDQAERVVLEAEDQVSPVVNQANSSLDSFEKKATTAHDKVVRITDQTRTSVQRLISSLEKQADTFGKTGVDRLISQRDQLLQRYAREPQAIDAITRSYEKMIAIEEKSARDALAVKAAKEAEEALQKQSVAIEAFGQRVSQSMENPLQGARGAISSVLTALGPFGVAVASGAAVLGAVALSAFEAAKSLGEYGTHVKDAELRTGLAAKEVGQFGFAARAVGQDISIVERLMRGLSQAADDNSKEGEKARTTLRGMGIDLHTAAGEMKPTSEILVEISEGLNKLPEGLQRDAAAMDLFKRVGVEAIPFMTELNDNLRIAHDEGFGPTEDDIRRFTEYQREVTVLETKWDSLVRKFKEGLVITVSYVGQGVDWFLKNVAAPSSEEEHAGEEHQRQDQDAVRAAGGAGAKMSISAHRQAMADMDRRAPDIMKNSDATLQQIADLRSQQQQLVGDFGLLQALAPTKEEQAKAQGATQIQGQIKQLQQMLNDAEAATRRTDLHGGKEETDRLRARFFGTHEGMEKAYADAKKDVERLQKELFEPDRPLTRAQAQDLGHQLQSAQTDEERRKAALDATAHGGEALKEFRRQAAEFEKKGDEAELDAIGKIFYQRDQLLKQAVLVKASEAEIAAIRKAADEQAGKIRTAETAKFDADWRKFEEYAQQEQAKRLMKNVASLGPSKEEMKEWEDWFRAQDQVASINLESQKDLLTREASHAQKMVGFSGAEGMDAVRETYQIRIDLAKQLAEVEAERILKETTGSEQLVAGARAMKALNKEVADAQEEAVLKQLEIQKQQMDSLKKESEGLWNTLLMHPTKFPKELASTIHEAVIKPVAEGMASMTANVLHPAIFGADGGGGLAGIFQGIFGGSKQADPIKISTDQNTTATILNSAHVAALTAVLAGAMGMTAPAVAAPTGIAGLAGVSVPSISVPARMATVTMTGGGGDGAAVPEASPTFIIDGGGGAPAGVGGVPSGGGAPEGGYSTSALSNLPMLNRGSPLSQLAPALSGKPAFPGLSQLESSVWNTKAYHGLPIDQTTFAGQAASSGLAVATSPMATAAGMMLATSGLMGKQMGSWGGVGMGTAGGALLGAGFGMQYGGPMGAVLGAGIGAVAGLGIGIGEKLAGIESPQVKAHNDIKQIYGVDIPQNSGTIKQVVSIAQSEFGNDIAVAVRSPKVRQLVMLYSEATGQKMPLSASTPYAGSLVEQGGNLYQQASFQNNAWHSYVSDLPTLGGIGGSTFPTTPGPNTTPSGSTYVSLNINGQPITSDFVADQSMAAQNASYGRTQQSANLQVPGLMVA